MKTSFLAYTYMLWMLACSSGSTGSSDRGAIDSKSVAPSMEQTYAEEGGGGSEEIQLAEQKIIRNGNMTLSVKDALSIRSEVNTLLDKHKAYVGNEHLDNTDYQTAYTLQIRVPAQNLDALVADIESLKGTVTSKSIQAQDVTEQYIDLETRLANKKSYLEQYRSLLKNARTIEDILKVREQIRVLEEEIESVTGRLKYLSNQVSLSTLDLTIQQIKDFVYRPDRSINFVERFKESISAGWFGFVSFCLYMLTLWPFWILGIALLWAWRKYRKRKLPAIPK